MSRTSFDKDTKIFKNKLLSIKIAGFNDASQQILLYLHSSDNRVLH